MVRVQFWRSEVCAVLFHWKYCQNQSRLEKMNLLGSHLLQVLFFLLIIIGSSLLAEIRWSVCMSKSHRSLCVSSSRTFVHMVKFNGSPCPPSRVYSYTPSTLIFCIRLLCDWLFRLCHQIAYICYFVESYLSSLWYDWFLWRCFVLLIGEILFLSESFLFLARFRFRRVRYLLVV